MQWLLSQPDHVLSQHEANKQFLCAEYTMLHPSIIGEARMANFIYQNLTKDLDVFTDAVIDEIDHALEHSWGTSSSDWKQIDLYDVMLAIVGRLVNRVLVGLPLCRDPGYLRSTTRFAQVVPLTGGIISLLPRWLKPVLGPVFTAYDNFHYWRISRIIEPLVKERLSTMRSSTGPKERFSLQPNDFIQWSLLESFSRHERVRDMPSMISKRLAVMSFAAIQSSALTITNALLDIAASPESLHIQDTLRLEAMVNAERTDGKAWTKGSVAGMKVTDSVLRESLRLWSFVSHGVTKAVVARQGVTLPSGEHLPMGSKCGIASYGPHHDDKIYRNPHYFDAFRHCAASETKSSLVTTGTYFMGFSHGRHAWYVGF